MLKKKSLLVLFPMAAALLASCAGASSSASSSSSAAASSSAASSSAASSSAASSSAAASSSVDYSSLITEDVTIEFVSNSSYGTVIDSVIEEFQADFPTVTVTNTKETGSYSDYAATVVSEFSTTAYPDLVVAYPDAINTFLQYGKVVALDDYIENYGAHWDVDDIIPAYIEEGQGYDSDGTTYSLPFAKSTELMYYNKDVLIGLDLSQQDATINDGDELDEAYFNNLTWEELFNKLCPAIEKYNNAADADHKLYISDNSGSYLSSIFGYDSDDNLFITLAQQYGYGYTSINASGYGQLDFVNDGMKSLVKNLNAQKNKGYFITKGSNENNYVNYNFLANTCLFSVGSTGGIKYQYSDSFETNVAPIPQAEDGTKAVINQGPSLCILDHGDSQRSLAAWLFYTYLTSPENAKNWAIETGYSPIRYSTFESSEWATYTNEESATGLDLLKAKVGTLVSSDSISDALFASPVFKGSDTARTQVGGIVTSALSLSAAECTDAAVNDLFNTAYNNTLADMD